MKNLFFPTDFSEAATKAFIYALHLADRSGATITTYHVYRQVELATATHMPISMQRVYDTIELGEFENYRDSIPALRSIAEEHGFDHVPLQHIMEEHDKVLPAILERAQSENADFIVMGTTGARGLKEIFLGSVAGEVIEKAHCPVLAVPEKNEFDGRIDQIVFSTSYQVEEKAGLDRVLDFAALFKASVQVVNVDTGHTEFYTRRMDKLREEYGNRPRLHFHVLEGVDIHEQLIAYLEENEVDILAMVTHKRGWLQELFNYSKAKQMVYHSATPVLSIPSDLLQ